MSSEGKESVELAAARVDLMREHSELYTLRIQRLSVCAPLLQPLRLEAHR